MKNKKNNLKYYSWSFWIIGFFALLWFILRTGTNPKRLSYPCQQAVYPLASSWVIAILTFIGGSLIFSRFINFSKLGLLIAAVIWFSLTLAGDQGARENTNTEIQSLPIWEVQNPVSRVFVMDNIPPTSGSLAAGDSTVPNAYLPDPAIDTMLLMMQKKNIYFYKTALHPDGIIDSNNAVILKGNFQWTSRNTTSTDRIKGVIWRILNHPDGFTGEILVCDNTQNIGTGINHGDNNSEDVDQSIIDVVNTFHSKGYKVHVLDWRSFWSVVVDEYSTGNYTDGYVYESSTKISYPKFKSPSGLRYISTRYGIWDSIASTYDSSKLCIIDYPVLKAHSIAGSTIAVKNWIGLLTTAYSSQRYGGTTPMHYTYFWGTYALVARIMNVTFPKLSIIDAAWTSRLGQSNLTYVQKTDMLVASTDPVASSWYAAKFILTPIAINPNATNPDYPGGTYRNTLTNWRNFLRDSANRPCTKDSAEISVYDRSVLTSIEGNNNNNIESYKVYQNYPNPFNPTTNIRYEIPRGGFVKLVVFDALGKEVTTLVNEKLNAGSYEVDWDGTDYPSGVYFYKLITDGFVDVKKMVLVK
ncbi:MAG: DUF362 domain-containing protein [Ignavibacteria bacterium]|nr:DUF362 domain-containing protein [Ignavibacteria bacterium]